MSELKQTLVRIISETEEITDLFYKQKNKESYAKLDSYLLHLMKTIEMLFTYQSEHNENNIDLNIINKYLTEALKAMEEKDTVLLADILKYDILIVLKNVMQFL